MALSRGDLPSSWYIVMKDLAGAKGIECPMCLFSFIQTARCGSAEQGGETLTRARKQSHPDPAIVRSHGGT